LRHQQAGSGGGLFDGLLFIFHVLGPDIAAQSANGSTHCGRLSAVAQQNTGQCAYTHPMAVTCCSLVALAQAVIRVVATQKNATKDFNFYLFC